MRLSEHLYLLIFLITGLLACKSGIQHAMTEIKDADSATIIYYDKPPDNRFFKVVKGKKPAELKSVIEDVNTSAQKNAEASCESIGKIYFYKGSEQVYVVYFSDKSCSRLAFIKNGQRYESEMSETSLALLNEWKTKATEPTSR